MRLKYGYFCNMKVAEQIRKAIECIPESQPFGYDDLGIEKTDIIAATKAIERLKNTGTIKKISKGVFYKPKITKTEYSKNRVISHILSEGTYD